MKKSDLLDTLRRLKPFAGTTHVNRLLSATGMESLESLVDFVESCDLENWERWLGQEIHAAEECIPMYLCGVDPFGNIVSATSPPAFQIISARHVGPEPERYTISQYWQTAGDAPVLIGRYQTNPAHWHVAGHLTWEQHIADML